MVQMVLVEEMAMEEEVKVVQVAQEDQLVVWVVLEELEVLDQLGLMLTVLGMVQEAVMEMEIDRDKAEIKKTERRRP